MDIVLQSHMIVIRASHKNLTLPWVERFVANYKKDLLFLSHAVIIYSEPSQEAEKKHFLTQACEHFAQKESLDAAFFVRSIMNCLHYPIKIVMDNTLQKRDVLNVMLKVTNPHQVSIELDKVDPWFFIYMQSKLHQKFQKISEKKMIVHVESLEEKNLLEQSLNRGRILSRKVHYQFEQNFIQDLFAQETFITDQHRAYYAILGCDRNASPQEIKNSYKKLVKTYHPDQVSHLKDEHQIVTHTQKFQMLQEAYHALKGA